MSRTQLLEIAPGFTMEVSARLKKKAGVTGKYVRRTLTAEEKAEALGGHVTRRTRAKYTKLMLDEALRIAKEVGTREASKLTKIKFWSIVQHKRRLTKQGLYKPKKLNRVYTKRYSDPERRMFMSIVYDCMKRGLSKTKAFEAAGKRTGFNAQSLYHQHHEGDLT